MQKLDQRCIQNLVKYLRWSVLRKIVFFRKSSISDVLLGSEYASADSVQLKYNRDFLKLNVMKAIILK